MSYTHRYLQIVFCIILTSCQTVHHDSVKVAKELSDNSSVASREVSYFLIEAIDNRRMDIEEATLAKDFGTTEDIREYSTLIIHDHTLMLKDISILAAAQNIKLPETLSHEKEKALKNLSERSGNEFDKKFIKMMIIDHRRDLREFEKATSFKDLQVQKLAKHYQPIIQSHLDLIQKLK